MSFQTILYENVEGVATIVLNRPESLNAFNDQMITETMSSLKSIAKDSTIRCVVIRGSGRAFSSGQDLKEFRERGESVLP